MPCQYEYETRGSIQQLSLQWRSPRNQLLCHLIKHKKYSNCTAGYSVHYNPGNITLVIAEVKQEDFGRHVCSVSKLHEFSDFSIELNQKEGEDGALNEEIPINIFSLKSDVFTCYRLKACTVSRSVLTHNLKSCLDVSAELPKGKVDQSGTVCN